MRCSTVSAQVQCPEEAVMAIRTTHGGRDTDGIKTTFWSAISDAPKSASVHCVEHGASLVSGLVRTMAGAL